MGGRERRRLFILKCDRMSASAAAPHAAVTSPKFVGEAFPHKRLAAGRGEKPTAPLIADNYSTYSREEQTERAGPSCTRSFPTRA